jgi:hypothetical protein
MLERILRWIAERKSTENNPSPQDLHSTGAHLRPHIVRSKNGRRRADTANTSDHKKPEQEKAATEDSLELIDDATAKSGEATGIDPYNTGGFDRSKNWDSHFRK